MARMDCCFWLVLAISYVAIVHHLQTTSHQQMRASNGTNITLINHLDLEDTPFMFLNRHLIRIQQEIQEAIPPPVGLRPTLAETRAQARTRTQRNLCSLALLGFSRWAGSPLLELQELQDQVASAHSLAQRHPLAPASGVLSSKSPKAAVDHDEQLPTATMKKWLLKHGLRASNGTINNPGRSINPDLHHPGTSVLPVLVDQQFSIWFYLMDLYPVLILIMAFCVQVLC